MERIKLEIIGLSYSQTQSGAYALILGEEEGKRRLPIIIGGFEAQAIAIELESMTPSRPLTHDLFKAFTDNYEVNITEIIIYNLVEGIFFAKIICEKDGKTLEIDSRTSDAVALAVRYACPIYTYEFILNSTGIVIDDDLISEEISSPDMEVEDLIKEGNEDLNIKGMDALKKELDLAISNENYERASKLRDEIAKRSQEN
ncbi:MAG: bifunctional DNase/RNase [Patiriisocius sp.]|jgi:bifunctional DNase/RNase